MFVEAVAVGISEDTIVLSLATEVEDGVIDCGEDEIREAVKVLALRKIVLVKTDCALAFIGFKRMERKVQVNVVVLCNASFGKDVIVRKIFNIVSK